MKSLNHTQSLESYITPLTRAVYDYQFVLRLKEIPISEWMEVSPPFDCIDEYLERIDYLIHTSNCSVKGLDQFTQKHLINGTTQSFDESYHRYSSRRLRIFRGEYAYHKRVNPSFVFLEDEPLQENDYIIISFPFCSSGDKHHLYDEILDQALKLRVPVEVDCAYFGTCVDINFDLSHPSIKAVSFSLTKGMGLGDIRSGIRYSNYNDQFPISQQNKYKHSVLLAAKIGLHMMERFNFDYIPNTYREHQLSYCNDLNIKPSKCMHIAHSSPDRFPNNIVDQAYCRLGIRDGVKLRKQGRI